MNLQIQCLKDHSAPISGLAFDRSLEYLASCATDSTIVVRVPEIAHVYLFVEADGIAASRASFHAREFG